MSNDKLMINESFVTLKARHRKLRQNFDESFSIRIHRALSWLERAEKEIDDADAAFIFYWISFNANYSIDRDAGNRMSEGQQFYDFFYLITKLDTSDRIYSIVWSRFTQEIRSLLNNEYIYANFWYISQKDQEDWKKVSKKQKKPSTML